MNKFLVTMGWKNNLGRWDRNEALDGIVLVVMVSLSVAVVVFI